MKHRRSIYGAADLLPHGCWRHGLEFAQACQLQAEAESLLAENEYEIDSRQALSR